MKLLIQTPTVSCPLLPLWPKYVPQHSNLIIPHVKWATDISKSGCRIWVTYIPNALLVYDDRPGEALERCWRQCVWLFQTVILFPVSNKWHSSSLHPASTHEQCGASWWAVRTINIPCQVGNPAVTQQERTVRKDGLRETKLDRILGTWRYETWARLEDILAVFRGNVSNDVLG